MKWFNSMQELPQHDGYYWIKTKEGDELQAIYTRSLGNFKDEKGNVINVVHWRFFEH